MSERWVQGRIEDIEWMAQTGEGLEGAARRLRIKVKSLQIFLEKHNRRDLLEALRSRDGYLVDA